MQKVQTPRVLNKKQLRGAVPNAVYIGRPSVWGNPFVIGKETVQNVGVLLDGPVVVTGSLG
jgi:hypothetical protein